MESQSSKEPKLLQNPNLSRRYACDRCRGQKLRCIRDAAVLDGACKRCQKVGTKCTTTSAAPIGGAAKLGYSNAVGKKRQHDPDASQGTEMTLPSNVAIQLQAQWGNIGRGSEFQDPGLASDFGFANKSSPRPPSWTEVMDFSYGEDVMQFQSPLNLGNSVVPVALENTLDAGNPSSLPFSLSVAPEVGPEEISHSSNEATDQEKASMEEKALSLREMRQIYIQELTDLNTRLLKDLDRALYCNQGLEYVFTASPEQSAEYLFQTLDEAMDNENSIGRIFKDGETFLDLIKRFHGPSSQQDTLEISPSPAKANEEPRDKGNVEQRIEERWENLQRHNAAWKVKPKSNPPTASESLANSKFAPLPGAEAPFALSLLTCYISIVKLFETLFTGLLHSLKCLPESALDAKFPPTVSNLNISGFQLTNRRLQTKILVEVGKDMLVSIEKYMGFGASAGKICSDPIFQTLLIALLGQNGLDCSNGNESGMKQVRDLIRKVEEHLV